MVVGSAFESNLHWSIIRLFSFCIFSVIFQPYVMDYKSFLYDTSLHLLCFLVERPTSILDVESGASLLAVPDPFHTLELSDAPGKGLSLWISILLTYV